MVRDISLRPHGYDASPISYAYWIGDFDGKTFSTSEEEPQWLDWGFDFYGVVTYPDYRANGRENLELRRAIGWNNFWDYPRNAPSMATDGYNGDDMIVRGLRMVANSKGNYLASVLVKQLNKLARATTNLGSPTISGEQVLDFSSNAYVLECELNWDLASPPANIGIELCRAQTGTRHVATGIYLAEGFVYVNRKPSFNRGGCPYVKSQAIFCSGMS